MRKIYKYLIDIHGAFSIALSDNAEFLHVDLDPTGQPCMWFMIDDSEPILNQSFRIAFTGEDYGKSVDKYLGTFQISGLVCHLFKT